MAAARALTVLLLRPAAPSWRRVGWALQLGRPALGGLLQQHDVVQSLIAAREAPCLPSTDTHNLAQVAQARSFSSSNISRDGSASSGSKLAAIMQKELEHEQEVYEQPETTAQGPPAPFILTQESGDTLLSLKRSFNGEQVSVECSVNEQEVLGSSDDAEAEVNFNVQVVKGTRALVFECVGGAGSLHIKHVSFEPREGYDSNTSYTGPVFSELEEELQQEFLDYLAERGITDELGDYLKDLICDKEQVEYMGWLQKVHDFVA